MNGVNAEQGKKMTDKRKNNRKVRKTFYKNKFRCRMFVPIDDNYYHRERKNDEEKTNSENT